MSSYPVFSGSPFATNANQLPFNPNQNVLIPPPVNGSQQNANMSYLSFPPPILPGSHHVFQNGPRFPGAVNSAPPAVFPANLGNPNGMSPPRFPVNLPGSVNMRPPTPFAANNQIPPASFSTQIPPVSFANQIPSASFATQNPPASIATQNTPAGFATLNPSGFGIQNPPVSFANQIPLASFTTQNPPVSFTTQNPPVSFANQIPPASFASQNPPVSFANQIPFAVQNTSAGFATHPAMTSMPPPSISSWSTPPNFHGNFQQFQNNPQGSNASNTNYWGAAASPNNFKSTSHLNLPSHSEEDVKPWGTDPTSLLIGLNAERSVRRERSSNFSPSPSRVPSKSTNNFQNREIKNNQHPPDFHNSIGSWSSNTNTPNLSNNLQAGPSNFGQSKSPVCATNAWQQPFPNFPGPSNFSNGYQFSNGHGNRNPQNFNGISNHQKNFDNRRGNSRNLNQRNNRQWQVRQFKDKRDLKTESNESKPFSCDTCDRAFSCQEEFKAHVSDHEKCNFKNCQFEAHPKIVALHKKMVVKGILSKLSQMKQ